MREGAAPTAEAPVIAPPKGVELVSGRTWHGRRGGPENAFAYTVDYLLLEPEARPRGPALYGTPLCRVRDADHGGAPGRGTGAAWARAALGADDPGGRLLLLAQPRVLGHAFNPVAFWLALTPEGTLGAVIAEVTNTYGDRHSYLVRHPDGAPIRPSDVLEAGKAMHVSPFQPVAGGYRFRFDLRDGKVSILIDYRDGDGGGLTATLTGARAPLTNAAILRAALRRPLGTRRGLALIHWQAVKLMRKGAPWRDRPAPPAHELSR